MIFSQTILKDAYIIRMEPKEDSRGFFARNFCCEEFRKNGIEFEVAQCNLSFNKRRGTLRGLHYQEEPFGEAKVVMCTRGRMYDVIVDLRRDSPTCGKWSAMELRGDSLEMVYIPQGFAHGFQTLEDETMVFYYMSQFFRPEYARGIRWDDPALDIRWPVEHPTVSDRDKSFGYFSK